MAIIWRGIGIIVPLAFVGFGALFSLWFDDVKLGNKPYVGWVCVATAIVSLIVGLMTLPGKRKDPSTGLFVPKKKHDFFYLPIILWAAIFGGLSIWLLSGFNEFKSSSEKLTYIDMVGMERGSSRTVHFYNPSADTLRFAYVNTDLLADSKWLSPGQDVAVELPVGLYQFVSFDQNNNERYQKIPSQANSSDTTRYADYKDPVDGSSKKLRSLKGDTKDYMDYDHTWLLLDPSFSFILVNVSELSQSKEKVTDEMVNEIDWQKNIYAAYNGDDLIEPYIKGVIRDEMFKSATVTVTKPNEKLPVRLSENNDVYVLIPFETGNKPTNEIISKQIISAGFE